MNDKELLEMAANAIGKTVRYNYLGGMDANYPWNPLEDDGDRYRLAKCLDIRIHFGPCYVTYAVNGRCGLVRWPEDAKDDAYAIVVAAANIGRAK